MEVSGVNNKNLIGFQLDKKVFYQFLDTPMDKVQLSPQCSDKKEKDQNNEMKEVADLLDPKKNYKRLAAKIAGVAGASALMLGVSIAAFSRGNSGAAQKMGTFLQKLRGQAYSLQNETSFIATIRYDINTKLVSLLDGGLNTWVNTEQLKNVFLDKKIVQKWSILRKPIYWTVDLFKKAAQRFSFKKYEKCVKEVKKLEILTNNLTKAIESKYSNISKDEISRLNKHFDGLGLQNGDTRVQVVEKVIKKIVQDTEKLASRDSFNNRQNNVDTRLEGVVKGYTDNFDVLSNGNGIIEDIKAGRQAFYKIRTSSKDLISRQNQTAFEETRNEVYHAKEFISRNIADNYITNINLLKEIENSIIEASKGNGALKTKYTTSYSEIIRNLEKEMKIYKEAGTSAGKIRREASIKTFEDVTVDFIDKINKDGFGSNEKLKEAVNKLNQATDTIKGEINKKGLVEELRELLKCTDANGVNEIKKDNGALYTEFKKRTAQLSKSLNVAAKFETDNLFYRLMDLKLGGGNFEVIGLSIPIGLGAYSISKADSHDERVSNGIRTTSVIGGGLLGWVISGVIKCLSAGPSIVFGLGFGLAFDKVGKFIDNEFWSKGKDWDAIRKQKKQEAKALKA